MKITFYANNNIDRVMYVKANGPGQRFYSTKEVKALSQNVHLYTAHEGLISPSGEWAIIAGEDSELGERDSIEKYITVHSRPMDDNWIVTITINPDNNDIGFNLTLDKK